jgi:DNA gyrase subunit A
VERNGDLVAMCRVHPTEDLMVVTDGGTIIRLPVDEIRTYSRQAMGVRIITPAGKQQVVSIHPVDASDVDETTLENIDGEEPTTSEGDETGAVAVAADSTADTPPEETEHTPEDPDAGDTEDSPEAQE